LDRFNLRTGPRTPGSTRRSRATRGGSSSPGDGHASGQIVPPTSSSTAIIDAVRGFSRVTFRGSLYYIGNNTEV